MVDGGGGVVIGSGSGLISGPFVGQLVGGSAGGTISGLLFGGGTSFGSFRSSCLFTAGMLLLSYGSIADFFMMAIR
jgi:hypothetical protein